MADRKLVTRFLLIISECMGRKSGLEEDREDFLEPVEEAVDIGEVDLIGRNK